VPVDVSESALTGAAESLLAERPGLQVHALIADFTAGLALPGKRYVRKYPRSFVRTASKRNWRAPV
jgi:uncharacterized SAM-dependent methyltransferase